MVFCTEATLARWRALMQPFDVAAEMMALTLNIAQSAFKRSSERRRALALLAASPDGSTEALLLAHGFST